MSTHTIAARPMHIAAEPGRAAETVCSDCLTACEEAGWTAYCHEVPTSKACFNCGYVPAPIVYELRATDAPESFDGFGTVTLARNPIAPTIRTVGILPEHLQWQLQRYASGWFTAEPATLAAVAAENTA